MSITPIHPYLLTSTAPARSLFIGIHPAVESLLRYQTLSFLCTLVSENAGDVDGARLCEGRRRTSWVKLTLRIENVEARRGSRRWSPMKFVRPGDAQIMYSLEIQHGGSLHESR